MFSCIKTTISNEGNKIKIKKTKRGNKKRRKSTNLNNKEPVCVGSLLLLNQNNVLPRKR